MQYTRRMFRASTICSSQAKPQVQVSGAPRLGEFERNISARAVYQTRLVRLGSVKRVGVKRVVSVSLGASGRDFCERLTLLGQKVVVERRGVDGDLKRAAALIRELDIQTDPRVDAIGLGGINLYLEVGVRRYALRDAVRLAANAKRAPVLDGGGLKTTLEKRVVERLHAEVNLKDKKVLVVSAVERFGMAEALHATGARMHYGDLVSILDVPLPLRSLTTVRALARVVLPVALRAPISWLYPTGAAQEQSAPAGRYTRLYTWAEVIAGDWHLIRRYLPERLDGKTILTNTTTAANVALLRERGAARLVTTTPRLNGRSLPTNVLEAAFVAVTGGKLLSPAELSGYVVESGLKGTFLELQG